MAEAEGRNPLPDITNDLVNTLRAANQVAVVSKIFATLPTNERRVRFAYDLLHENGLLPQLSLDGKSDEKSEEFRQKGNEMYKKRMTRDAHEFYTKSVAFGETGSANLALAHANRSAVLFEQGLYEECLSDIEEALQNNYPDNLKPKLTARQAKVKGISLTQTKVDFYTPIPVIAESKRNSSIQSAANSIKIENSETVGRHIVTTRDIEPGEIIAIEKPFCHVLTDEIYTHCYHCLKLCYTLTPCPKCTEALFCSKTCQTDANLAYHRYECPLLLTIKKMELTWRLIHLRVTILARDKYDALDECVVDDESIYRSDRYNEIHNLVANTSSRSVSDLFNRAVTAASFYHLMKTHTGFFENKTKDFEATFTDLLLFHMQTGPCNFHEVTEGKSSDNSLEQLEIGAGAYSFLSMFNHSCCPNVDRYSYGSTIVVMTIERIKMGEQCFDNYGYHHAVMSKAERQAKLKKQYLFDCTCTACTDDYPLYESMPSTPGEFMISMTDLQKLENNDLEGAKKIFKKLVKKIVKLGDKKPNKHLGELQEALKHCCFIFRTIKTPI